jgi:hypothetical protein
MHVSTSPHKDITAVPACEGEVYWQLQDSFGCALNEVDLPLHMCLIGFLFVLLRFARGIIGRGRGKSCC